MYFRSEELALNLLQSGYSNNLASRVTTEDKSVEEFLPTLRELNQCRLCAKQFFHNSALQHHMQTQHRVISNWKISQRICRKTRLQFVKKTEAKVRTLKRKKSVRRKNTDNRFYCCVCEKTFKHEAVLNRHVAILHLRK